MVRPVAEMIPVVTVLVYVPSGDPIAIASLASANFHVLYTMLGMLAPEAPKKAEPALAVLASLTPPTQPKPGFARRLADIRCSAALALAVSVPAVLAKGGDGTRILLKPAKAFPAAKGSAKFKATAEERQLEVETYIWRGDRWDLTASRTFPRGGQPLAKLPEG